MDTRPLPDRLLLLRAFNRIRPHYWGEDLDDALGHPIRRVAIIAVARRIERLGDAGSADKPAELTKRNSKVYKPPPTKMDFKRLASGEKEDD